MDTAICKLCNSANTIKFGIQADTQMYYCKDCKRKFKADDSLFGHRVPATNISSALLEYYSGMSVNDIRRLSKQENGFEPAGSTVYQWIDKFTDKAVNYYAKFQPKVGDVWIADETVISMDGKDVWLWDIIDDDTRFLLASKMSYTRTIEDAKTLFELAKNRAGKSPKVILTDKLRAYPEAIEQVFGADSTHIKSSPFVTQDSTRKIERWHETLKERTKVLYGLKDTNSALAFIDGFLVFYNFIREHKGLDDKTPAEQAGIDYKVKNWADVIRLDEPKQQTPEYAPEYVTPGYAMPQELAEARQVVGGTPYHAGKRRGITQKDYNRQKAVIKAKKTRLKKKREAKKSEPSMTIGRIPRIK